MKRRRKETETLLGSFFSPMNTLQATLGALEETELNENSNEYIIEFMDGEKDDWDRVSSSAKLHYIISASKNFFRVAQKDMMQIKGNPYFEENENFESPTPKGRPVKFEAIVHPTGKHRWAKNISFISPAQF